MSEINGYPPFYELWKEGLVVPFTEPEPEPEPVAPDPPSELWEHHPEDDEGYGDYFTHFLDPEGWYSARVKWDGCVDFYRYMNIPLERRELGEEDECDCYIHICNIDDMIKRLEALREQATAYYTKLRGGWPG